MNATLLIFASLLALATCNFKFGEKAMQALTAVRNECFASENVDAAFINRLDTYEIPSRDDLKCHSLCVFKKFNAIDENGAFNFDVFKPYVPETEFAAVMSIINKCNVVTTDLCEKAHELHSCFNQIVYKQN
ncbi:PREDICTED: uncharacterized protein LOC108562100 [Nicrophorus vespilloides]|uniref:Uncharacterized protein LOC108562100 n=1 Tax=Nicrophorus vespilloides TaxID=110193 RepID=A0ABM1MMJ5_NICVS|nr:PREDICTED: uncharacterized protein LOC108562100 [Nicrophorus vespilloides]